MENKNEKYSELAAIPPKLKILAIGGSDDKEPNEWIYGGSQQKTQHDTFRRHFCFLITGSKTPIEVVEDWSSVDSIGVASIKKDNTPRRYHFLCKRGSFSLSDMIFAAPTFNARETLNVVKNRLKDENWITENVIETPLRTKLDDGNYYSYDLYIEHIVTQALEEESRKLFGFIQFLHRSKIK